MGAGKKRKKNKYIEYDYESQYENDLQQWNEYFVEQMLKDGRVKCVYATKEIKAGEQLEVEIYPEFTRREAKAAGIKPQDRKKQREAQKALNDRRSRKQFWRLAEHNFNNGDLWLTLTYDEEHKPETMEEAIKCFQKFIRNINGKRKRRGLDNAKYLYVTETVTEDGEPVRAHHHVFMDGGLSMEEIEKTWKYGRRNECRKIEKDQDGIKGASNYMTKQKADTAYKKHAKKWAGSNNLKKPPEKKHHQTRKKDVNKMALNFSYIQEYVENNKRYAGYIYREASIYYNDHNARFYIRVRMRKGEETDHERAEEKRAFYRRATN